MTDIQHTSGSVQARAGTTIFYQRWTSATARTPLVIIHGAGEHSGRYEETATRLVQEGCSVFACDLEGHGRSPGIRGHVPSFECYLDDARALVTLASTTMNGQRPILLGHSLGGLIATWYAVQAPETVPCLVLTSPAWGVNLPIPLWKRMVAYILSVCWPSVTMRRSQFPAANLSHDPGMTARYLSDPLNHAQASAGLYVAVRRRMAQLPQVLPRLQMPVLVLQAGDDRIASADATRRLFPLLGTPQKQLIVYEGFFHEVLNEVKKAHVLNDLVTWLRSSAKAIP